MDTQITDSYRAMINSKGIPMIIVSDLDSAFEPETVYLTQSGLNAANDKQRLVIRNLDSTLIQTLRETKYVFLALTDKEYQQFTSENVVEI